MPGGRYRDKCCRRLRGSGVEMPVSMGLRPRLSAAAAFAARLEQALGWRPRLSADAASRLYKEDLLEAFLG